MIRWKRDKATIWPRVPVPWTARRSNQSILKEIGPEYSEELISEVAQWCLTLCDPMDCSLPGSSIHGIFQARILQWVAISFSKRSSQPRDWTQVSRIVGRRFTVWATREGLMLKLKLQSFGHLMWRTDSLEKTLMLGENWRQEEKGMTEDEMTGWHHQLDRHEFE